MDDLSLDPYMDMAAMELSLDTIGQGLQMAVGPEWPKDRPKPPRPKLAEVIAAAHREMEDHAGRLEMLAAAELRINGDVIGNFEKHQELVQLGEIEQAPLTDLRDETDLGNTTIVQMTTIFEDPYRDVIVKEEARSKEDFCYFNLEHWRRAHSRAYGGSLDWAIVDDFQKAGMAAAFAGINPDNQETGIDTMLVDPRTVFPIFEDDLAEVYRVYETTAARLIGTYRKLGPQFEKKIRKIARGKSSQGYDPHAELEVIEFWDRNWLMIVVDNEAVITIEHKYTKVPFKIKYACFGRQGHTQATGATRAQTIERIPGLGSQRFIANVTAGGSNRRDTLMQMAQPFLWRRFAAHDVEEAVLGLALTKYRRSYRPPQVAEQDLTTIDEGPPLPDWSEGGVTGVLLGEKLTKLDDSVDLQVANIVAAGITQNKATGMSPGVTYGQSPGSQTTGSALNVLSSNGMERFVPLAMLKEEFLADVAEWWLEMFRDWGSILGATGNRGTLQVPARNPRAGMSNAHEVTPDLIERAGIRMNAKLKRFDPLQAGTIANALMILQSLPNGSGISTRSIIEISGYTDDVDGEMEQIEREQLRQVPEVLQMLNLDQLAKQAAAAEQLGDIESSEQFWAMYDYLAEKIWMDQMMKNQVKGEMGLPVGPPGIPGGMMPPPGQEPLLPGVQPPLPPPPLMLEQGGAPIMAQGQSMPAYGRPVGTQGGRPPGAY